MLLLPPLLKPAINTVVNSIENYVAKPIADKAMLHGPRLIAKPIHLLPKVIQHKPLEVLLNKMFAEFIEDEAFDFLENRWLKLTITDMQLTWRIGYNGSRLITASCEGPADVKFSGTANDLILMASRKTDPDALFFSRRLSIEGDTELGLAIKNIIDSFDMDELPTLAQWLIDKAGNTAKRVETLS